MLADAPVAGASESSVAASGDSTVAPAAPAAPVASEAVSVAAGEYCSWRPVLPRESLSVAGSSDSPASAAEATPAVAAASEPAAAAAASGN